MAVRQSSISEIRYSKHDYLTQEAKILENMYRDQIHQQGIDCTYYKLNTQNFKDFKNIIDKNTVLRNAYGYECEPEYNISSKIIAFMEVDNDIFQLNKYGLQPNMDVTFAFSKIEFACEFASKLGRYVEYDLTPMQLSVDVTDAEIGSTIEISCHGKLSSEVLSGSVKTKIDLQLDDNECHEVDCTIYESINMPKMLKVNEYIEKSFNYRILDKNDNIIAQPKLTYCIHNVNGSHILSGYVHGKALFYDLSEMSKYMSLIHPDVGDVIVIEFPHGDSHEQYEITEAIDKQMTQDGINAFLHKYIWKCKARRYINSYEGIEHNEANEQLEEKLKHDQVVQEEVADSISLYNTDQDDVYGGYENNLESYDKQDIKHVSDVITISAEYGICLMEFKCGSKLLTDGYDLMFEASNGSKHILAIGTTPIESRFTELKLLKNEKFIKASDNQLVFTNIDGENFILTVDRQVLTDNSTEICLNSLFDRIKDINVQNEQQNDDFYKFSSTRTLLYATTNDLYCKLATGKICNLTKV